MKPTSSGSALLPLPFGVAWSFMIDPMEQFEHDHGELTTLVLAVKTALDDAQRGTILAEGLRSMLVSRVDDLRDDLVAHFAREEEGLFPFVVERLPDLQGVVEHVRIGHDTICGTLVRLSLAATMVSKRAEVALLTALFERFEVAYVAHSKEERDLLRTVRARLDEGQRRQLSALVEGL